MRKGLGTLLMLAVVALLQYWIWVNPQGLLNLVKMRDKLSEKRQRAHLLQKQNDQIREEIEFLRDDSEASELRARGDLGMIKDGEKYYQVSDQGLDCRQVKREVKEAEVGK